MKTLYFECNMGAAGDMLTAALLELHPEPERFIQKLNGIGLPGVRVTAEPSVKCGITGTHISVTVGGAEEYSVDVSERRFTLRPVGAPENPHTHSHGEADHTHGGESHSHGGVSHTHSGEGGSGMDRIARLINSLGVSGAVRRDALAIYGLIADAESHVHGVPVSEIHFHEVGSMDAVADIVGVCMLIEELAPEKILASPIHVGSGQVRCSHGILPVPAPATAHILTGVPIYGGSVRGELCTPTGAAILRYYAAEFGQMPVMTVRKTGCGMGRKDFENANCVRAFLGESTGAACEVLELSCNLDDMTPEAVAFAMQLMLEGGALDVYTTAIGMKKSRPGLMLTCMCCVSDRDKMLGLIFRHTSTLGVRENTFRRYTLERELCEVQTKYGAVRIKKSHGYGAERSKPEYEDAAKIARDNNITLAEVMKELE